MQSTTITRGALLFTVLTVLGATEPARAESIFGMSFFGNDTFTADAAAEGRAGTGLAYTDSMNAHVLVPTQLVDLERVTVGITSKFESRDAEDSNGSIRRSGLVMPSVRIGFPIFGRGGFGTGFVARRSTQWEVDRPYALDSSVTERIEREGTLFSVPLQFGLRLTENVVVGGGFHLERGAVRIRYELEANNADADPRETREDIFSGVAPELALALQNVGPVSVAGYWIGQHDADVDVKQRGVALSNREDSSRTDTMPSRFGVGTRIQLPGLWNVGLDYERQNWSEYEGRLFTYTDGVFDPNGEPQDLQDEVEWRIAVEKASERVGLRHTLPLRLGAYHRVLHYRLGGEDVTEWGVTVGSGLALRAGWARTDFAIGYSRMGSTSDNGVAEDTLRLVFSVSGGEKWY